MVDDTDPRLTGEHVRRARGTSKTLTLVGVVHDHPASTYRVTRTVERLDPDVLALELPPIAVPLFEQYARDERDPPVFGGEMSAAIQAADADAIVGIDRPSCGYLLRLVRTLLRERPSPTLLRSVLSSTVSATTHALVCRLAAAVAGRTPVRVEVDRPTSHETDRSDPPEDQARDERDRIRRSRAFTNAFRTASSTRASRLEDATRERHMAARLSNFRSDGDVVAVVGLDHLDPLFRHVDTNEAQEGRSGVNE